MALDTVSPAEMTAAQMERTPHKRVEVGFTAITERGEVYIWVTGINLWVCLAPLLRAHR